MLQTLPRRRKYIGAILSDEHTLNIKLNSLRTIFVFSQFHKHIFKSNRSQMFFKIGALKGALSGLRQLLATECPLKIMKNAFYFTLKALFVLKTLKFLS